MMSINNCTIRSCFERPGLARSKGFEEFVGVNLAKLLDFRRAEGTFVVQVSQRWLAHCGGSPVQKSFVFSVPGRWCFVFGGFFQGGRAEPELSPHRALHAIGMSVEFQSRTYSAVLRGLGPISVEVFVSLASPATMAWTAASANAQRRLAGGGVCLGDSGST